MPKAPFIPATATQILRQAVKGAPGTVGVFVTDLMSGQTASLHPFELFIGASTLKIPIAMAVLKLVTDGKLSLGEEITYTQADFEAGTGILQGSIQPGDRISVERLLELLITVSDNIARNMLERYIGSETIRAYMLSIGATPSYEPDQPLITPAGMNKILIALDAGKAGLSPKHTQRLLDWMKSTVHNTRLPANLPPNVTVAHKIGSWPGQIHDVGLVYAPERSFAISVFTKDIPEPEAEQVIARVARAVYDYEDSLASADPPQGADAFR